MWPLPISPFPWAVLWHYTLMNHSAEYADKYTNSPSELSEKGIYALKATNAKHAACDLHVCSLCTNKENKWKSLIRKVLWQLEAEWMFSRWMKNLTVFFLLEGKTVQHSLLSEGMINKISLVRGNRPLRMWVQDNLQTKHICGNSFIKSLLTEEVYSDMAAGLFHISCRRLLRFWLVGGEKPRI